MLCDVERKDAHALGHRYEAQLKPPVRPIWKRELVLHSMVSAIRHASPKDGEHGRAVDARVALHHGPTDELLSGLLPLLGNRVVDVEIFPVEPDHLAALQE